MIITVTGKWDRGRQVIVGSSVTFGPKTEQVDFEPVYSLKGNLQQKRFRKYMRQALDEIKEEIPESLPSQIRENYQLLSIQPKRKLFPQFLSKKSKNKTPHQHQ